MKTYAEKLGELSGLITDVELSAQIDLDLSENDVAKVLFWRMASALIPTRHWPETRTTCEDLFWRWVGTLVKFAGNKQSGPDAGAKISGDLNLQKIGVVYAVGEEDWISVWWADGSFSAEQTEDLEII